MYNFQNDLTEKIRNHVVPPGRSLCGSEDGSGFFTCVCVFKTISVRSCQPIFQIKPQNVQWKGGLPTPITLEPDKGKVRKGEFREDIVQ
jgi:hypothetical protein